ncbi:MAG TPA: capsule biosynthesis protein [Firmicutes bacterium]|nr:capsule biosynthesis protein [Bacillota bacterium]
MKEKLKSIKWLNVSLFVIITIGLLYLAQLFIQPDMVGWDIERVKHYDAGNDLSIQYDFEYSTDVEYGVVYNQEKCDQTQACDVTLKISKGKDVSQFSEKELTQYLDELVAKGLINEEGIIFEEATFSNEIEKGYPITYVSNPYESTINITLSKGLETKVYQATMVGVGDILLHDTVYNSVKGSSDNYDFSSLLKEMMPYIEPADFAFVNQETNIGGTSIGLSSYPSFNSPYEIVSDLRDIGFNMFSRANNHTLDRGEAAIVLAQQHFETFDDIITAGSTTSFENRDTIPVIEMNGITVSLLAYSYGFNGYIVPEGKEYLANEFSYDTAREDIKKAKQISDVVVVSMHWGYEYQSLPADIQLEQAQFLADEGVHIVMGHHPHVIQPVDKLIGTNGNETLVMYSLGNFVSGQTGLEKQVGGVVKFDITKTTVGTETFIELSVPQFMPTYNYPAGRYTDYRLVPLIDSTQKNYFNEVKTLLETYSDEVEVVEYITYN